MTLLKQLSMHQKIILTHGYQRINIWLELQLQDQLNSIQIMFQKYERLLKKRWILQKQVLFQIILKVLSA
ncbi:hypothetical protein A9G22_09620 [Gilliamella sp. App2-1]|nr:hypothetical protein A9G22_09620 [Gilliamella apicola]OCG22598.1 hypothetical protein A9G23_02905 [Gilliamella apicola]